MHRPLFSSVFKALPLVAAFFAIAADGDACHIVIDDNDDAPGCTDLADVCPALFCENGNVVNDDGCATCECADVPVCDVQNQPVPECAFPVFDEVTCSWFCDTEPFGCFSDLDCGRGFVCELSDCEAGGSSNCAFAGVCVPVSSECFSDSDCGDGFRCDVSGGGTNGGGAPPPDGDSARPAPPPAGQCVPVDEPACFSDEECGFGRHCEFFDGGTGGLVARAGVCVDDAQACDFGGGCAPGQFCQDGQCVDGGVPCTSDFDCHEGDACVFGVSGERAPCFDNNGDGQCDDELPPPPQGICLPVNDGICADDSDCAQGETCQLSNDCFCTAECRDDGQGGCLPCACPTTGFCVAVTTECSADAECAPGEICQFEATGCDQPCRVGADGEMICHPCDPVLVGTCQVQNNDPCALVRCGGGTTCQVSNGQAECVVTDGCFSNEECADGLLCNAADVCLPPPGCDPNTDSLGCPAVCYGSCFDPRAAP